MLKRLITILLVILAGSPAPLPAQSPRPLRVMLYPYIPDINNDKFAALVSGLEEAFALQHPDIDLTIIMDPSINSYGIPDLRKVFTDPNGPQLVELDLMMLNAVIKNGWIRPVSYWTGDVFPVAMQAARYAGKLWAIPTRVCSLFLFAFNPQIVGASSSADLDNILQSLDPQGTIRNLVGGFFGVNSLSIYYADFYIGDNGFQSIPHALDTPPDTSVVDDMAQLFRDCTFQGQNPCLSEVYQDESVAPIQFAQGNALSFIGFSEALYYILANQTVSGTVYTVPAPLGGSVQPMIYTDGFTINARNCDSQCQLDAQVFTDFYLSSDVQSWITLGMDSRTPVTRYVLPAQPSFYQLPPITADPYFDEFLPAVTNGQPFPTDGYVRARGPLFREVCADLDSLMPDDPCRALPTGK